MEKRFLKGELFTGFSHALFSCAESSEILDGLWDGITEEAEQDSSLWDSIDFNVEVDLVCNSVKWST